MKRRFKFSNNCNFFICEQKRQVWVCIVLAEIKFNILVTKLVGCVDFFFFFFLPFCSDVSVWETREEGTIFLMACEKKNRSQIIIGCRRVSTFLQIESITDFQWRQENANPRVHRSSGKLGKPHIPLECWTLGLGFSCSHWTSQIKYDWKQS